MTLIRHAWISSSLNTANRSRLNSANTRITRVSFRADISRLSDLNCVCQFYLEQKNLFISFILQKIIFIHFRSGLNRIKYFHKQNFISF